LFNSFSLDFTTFFLFPSFFPSIIPWDLSYLHDFISFQKLFITKCKNSGLTFRDHGSWQPCFRVFLGSPKT
jgi:hypothetical protein